MKPRQQIVKPNFLHVEFFEGLVQRQEPGCHEFCEECDAGEHPNRLPNFAPLRLPTMRRVDWHVRSVHFWYEGKARALKTK